MTTSAARSGQRFAHVLVDEFQDTDPLQTEIFWRLCGEPVDGEDDWTGFRIRPGALFLVGDPKQAIYRFRGADVGAYVQARDAFRAQDPGQPPVDLHQFPLLRLDPHLRQRALRGRALGRWAAGLHRARPVS